MIPHLPPRVTPPILKATAHQKPSGKRVPDPIALSWLFDNDVWVDKEPKLMALKELVNDWDT